MLDHASIDTEVIESRAKTVDSFVKKVKAEGQRWPDPLTEVLAGLDRVLAEPAPDHIRDGLAEVLEETRGLLPVALPVVMLSLAYAVALRGELDPEFVMLTLNLPQELTEGLEPVLYEEE